MSNGICRPLVDTIHNDAREMCKRTNHYEIIYLKYEVFSRQKTEFVSCCWVKNKNSAEDICGFGLLRTPFALLFIANPMFCGELFLVTQGRVTPNSLATGVGLASRIHHTSSHGDCLRNRHVNFH